MNTRLSQWINAWKSSLDTWSVWSMNLGLYPRDRLSTHCFAIEIERRPGKVDSPKRLFKLVGGGVFPRSEILEILEKTKSPEDFIGNWKKDQRGDNTVQIVIHAEGFFRFLWFSIKDEGLKFRDEGRTTVRDALETNWYAGLEWAIERDTEATDKVLPGAIQAALTVEQAEPDIDKRNVKLQFLY